MPISQSELQAAAARIEEMRGQDLERSTSVAKQVDPVQDGPLAAAADLREAYDEAQEIEEPPPAWQKDTTVVGSSAAKQIDPQGLDRTSLANAPGVQEDFRSANEPPVNDNTPPIDPTNHSGSKMVQDAAFTPNAVPDMDLRQASDRESFDQRWQAEQDRAAALQQDIDRIEEVSQELGPERDHDRGMGGG